MKAASLLPAVGSQLVKSSTSRALKLKQNEHASKQPPTVYSQPVKSSSADSFQRLSQLSAKAQKAINAYQSTGEHLDKMQESEKMSQSIGIDIYI